MSIRNTSALTVTSDPLPQIIDGVPLRMQTVNVTIDRPGFMFNPTNCSQQVITGIDHQLLRARARVSQPVRGSGLCGPAVQTLVQGLHAGQDEQSQRGIVDREGRFERGQANIAKVRVQLPKQLPARLTTLQKACTEAQFNTNPAGCPVQSDVGNATAVTPLLAHPLTGPAYLVSHGGAAFPDLVFVLQGEGITALPGREHEHQERHHHQHVQQRPRRADQHISKRCSPRDRTPSWRQTSPPRRRTACAGRH